MRKLICPGCNSKLDVHENIINSPRLSCPLCGKDFKNPFLQSDPINFNSQKRWAIAFIIIVVVVVIGIIIDNNSNSSATSPSYSNSNSNYDNDFKLNELKEEVRVLYNSLLSFKGNSDFHAYGFGKGYKYNKWLTDIESLENTSRQKQLFIPEFSVGDLKMLGLEYVKIKGRENEYTKWIRKRLDNGLN